MKYIQPLHRTKDIMFCFCQFLGTIALSVFICISNETLITFTVYEIILNNDENQETYSEEVVLVVQSR